MLEVFWLNNRFPEETETDFRQYTVEEMQLIH